MEGRALRAVQGLTVSEDNYEAAIDILQQRFGKHQQIISAAEHSTARRTAEQSETFFPAVSRRQMDGGWSPPKLIVIF